MAEQKKKAELTWLQCQLARSEWDNLNARRLALKLTWADIIVPGTKKYLDYFEATRAKQVEPKPEKVAPVKGEKASTPPATKKAPAKQTKATDASTEAPAVATMDNKADEKKGTSKSKAPATKVDDSSKSK